MNFLWNKSNNWI